MARTEVSVGEALGGMTMEFVVTGVRRAKLRIRLGTALLRLASRVMGCDVEVSFDASDADVIRYLPIDGGPERVVYGRRVRTSD